MRSAEHVVKHRWLEFPAPAHADAEAVESCRGTPSATRAHDPRMNGRSTRRLLATAIVVASMALLIWFLSRRAGSSVPTPLPLPTPPPIAVTTAGSSAESEEAHKATERTPVRALHDDGAHSPNAPAVEDPLVITGHVVRRGLGTPVAGARVVAKRNAVRDFAILDSERARESTHVATVDTDDDGAFELRFAFRQSVDLDVSADGLAPSTATSVRTGEDLRIELGRTGTLSGRVTFLDDGSPCAGALVTAATLTSFDERGTEFRGISDENGAYRIERLPPGRKILAVIVRDAVPPDSITVTTEEGRDAQRDIRLARGAVVHGVVRDAVTHDPIPGATVYSLDPNAPPGILADDEGRYRITGIRDDTERPSRIAARADGHAAMDVKISPGGRGDVECDIELPRATLRARGRVIGPDARPREGAWISLQDGYLPGGSQVKGRRWRTTGADGTFEFDALRGDTHHVLVVGAEGLGAKVFDFPVEFGPRGEFDFGDVRLDAQATIAGRVTDEEGLVVPGVVVELVGANSDRTHYTADTVTILERRVATRRARTDARGRFAFSGLSGGDYRAVGTLPGLAARSEVAVTVAPAATREDVVVVLRMGSSIAGQVRGPDGRPVAGAGVDVYAPGVVQRVTYALSDDEGGFVVHGLAPGSYDLVLSPAFVDRQEHGVDLVGGRTVAVAAGSKHVTLVLGRSQSIRGHVRYADGGDAGDVELLGYVDGREHDAVPDAWARTDARGNFTLPAEAGRSYTITSYAAKPENGAGARTVQYALRSDRIAAGRSSVELVLERKL